MAGISIFPLLAHSFRIVLIEEDILSSRGKSTFFVIPVVYGLIYHGCQPISIQGGLSLNADSYGTVVYQTICHGYDKTFIFTALITLVNRL